MHFFIYFVYPVLAFVLLYGIKKAPKGAFHENFLSLSQSKALQGFAAICILLHHIAQNTCAPWLEPDETIPGLEPFVPIGYLCVALFLFCSGYGLMKSYKSKENYLKDFLLRRALHPFFLLIVTDIILILLMSYFPHLFFEDNYIPIPTPFHMGGAVLINEYSWFIYAIIIMYIAFYLSFKFCPKCKIAILLVFLASFGYMAFCDWWMYGNWWFNTIILFPLGLLFAEYEVHLISLIKANYEKLLGATPILFLICFFAGENPNALWYALNLPPSYFIQHWLTLGFQMAAAVLFMFLLILFSMKIQIGNRILSFFGVITAEIYLFHTILLQIFSTPVENSKLFTIDNLALYVLVLLVLSTAVSSLLYFPIHFLMRWVAKKPTILRLLKKDVYIISFILVGFLLFSVISIMNESNNLSKQSQNDLEKYKRENITYAKVDDLNMAAYVTGEGTHTIVLLGGSQDYFSTVSLQPLANHLAKSNRVIVLDYFGCGFSDDTTKERTVDNYVYEIRTALSSLAKNGPYILMPCEFSGLYALQYATEYPEEIEAIIALDSMVGAHSQDIVSYLNLTPQSYRTRLEREQASLIPLNAFARFTGLNRTTWFMTEHFFKYSQSENTLPILEELYHNRVGNRTYLNAWAHSYDNQLALTDVTYPSNLPVLSILGSQSVEGIYYPESDWMSLHQSLITNPEIQEIKEIPGNPYFAFFKPKEIAREAQSFIDNL